MSSLGLDLALPQFVFLQYRFKPAADFRNIVIGTFEGSKVICGGISAKIFRWELGGKIQQALGSYGCGIPLV